jgi:hypothetical protein
MTGRAIESPDLPRRLGPYWLEKTLGRGGMSVVYRARDLDSGAVVALKTLGEVDASLLASLRREILVLSRVDHPGVVRVLASGVDDGVPWYAMELIEGESLEGYGRAQAAAGPWRVEAVEARLRVLSRLCRTLAFLHGQGIVHRDLKPTNVIIRQGGRPVLVDFGLVSRFAASISREPLEIGGEILGTLAYMSPEQAAGQYADARADLYALGCMLYEVVTGAPPFAGGPWEVMRQHLEAAPDPPGRRTPGVPEELEELILRLLAKEPRQRPPYAAEVADRIAALLPGDPEAPGAEPRFYLYRPSFSGRSEQLADLAGRLDRVREGRGAGVLVAGESGVGKTRFAMEAARLATARELRIVTGECIPLEGAGPGDFLAAPLHPLRPLLRAVADECVAGGAETTRRLLGDRTAVLAPYEESLRQVPGYDPRALPPDLPTEGARARLVEDLRETGRAFAAQTPLLLVIDDLQWADEMTVAFLSSLTPEFLEGVPLLVLGTYRSEEARPAVRELSGAPHFHRIELDRIDDGIVQAIVSDMLAVANPSPALVRFLTESSEGNPFFLAEYLRAAVESGVLRRSSRGTWEIALPAREEDAAYESLPLPRALRDLLERRLSELDTSAERCLEAAAVLGREFELELAAALCGVEEETLLQALGELLRREIVGEIDGLHYRFSHDKLREAAYARIPDAARTEMHRVAARRIEERCAGEEDPGRYFGVLAHHWSMAGVVDKSLDYLGKAGAAALRAGAPRDARTFLQRAVDTDDRSGRRTEALERARWLRMLGEAHAGTGDLASAIERTIEGTATLGRGLPRSGLGWLGVFLVETGRQLAHRLTGAAGRPPLRRSEADLEAALASGRVATSFYFAFELLRGTTSSLRCINLAERGGSPGIGALSYAQLGYVAGGLRLHGLARRYFAIARAVGEQGDPSAFAAGVYFEAMYQSGLGRWEESERLAAEAASKLEKIANRQEFEVAATVLSNTLYFQGRFHEADAQCQIIFDSAQRRANAQHAGWGLFLSGRSLLALGNVHAAAERLERGYALLSRVPDVVSLVICEGLLARARLAVGREAEALELADRLSERRYEQGRRVVSLVQCLDGYRSLADVYWLLWQKARDGEGATQLRRRALLAARDLGFFAWLFPIAVPAALRARARVDWSEGRSSQALRRWRRSAVVARRLAMPYDEALALLDLAGAAEAEGERAEYAERAQRMLSVLGCSDSSIHRGIAA